jgi:hypothetical protein
MPSRERVGQFVAMVERGRFVQAMEEFYAPRATMQENLGPLRRGLPALVAHEKGVLAAFESVRVQPVDAFLVQGDRVVIHWVFELRGHDGRELCIDELAWQLWQGDKIVEERFYYDPVQQRPPLALVAG